jgi:hypothetical protein
LSGEKTSLESSEKQPGKSIRKSQIQLWVETSGFLRLTQDTSMVMQR